MIGWNANGEFVDFTNSCANCKYPMPLPQMARKHCPRCGTLEPGSRLIQNQLSVRGSCTTCYAPDQRGNNYCTNCGAKLR